MRSPASPKCKLGRHFAAAALHNRALRIMGVMRCTALRPLCGVRDYAKPQRRSDGPACISVMRDSALSRLEQGSDQRVGRVGWPRVVTAATLGQNALAVIAALTRASPFHRKYLRPPARFRLACVPYLSNECGVRRTPWPTTPISFLISPQSNCADRGHAVAGPTAATTGPAVPLGPQHPNPPRHVRRHGRLRPKPSRYSTPSSGGCAMRRSEVPGTSVGPATQTHFVRDTDILKPPPET